MVLQTIKNEIEEIGMPFYTGNAIYDYIKQNNLDYFFCVKNSWTLIYGDSKSDPKLFAFVKKVNDLESKLSEEEVNQLEKAKKIAENLSLPFIFICFQDNSNELYVQRNNKKEKVTFEGLKDIFSRFNLSNPGVPFKPLNQYSSSLYHDWQRKNLGNITVSDLDLVKFDQDDIIEIIELKRSKKQLRYWTPYEDDFPNFKLIINAIFNSKRKINFSIYYNLLREDRDRIRTEDISLIKVFNFEIPSRKQEIDPSKYTLVGCFRPKDLLN